MTVPLRLFVGLATLSLLLSACAAPQAAPTPGPSAHAATASPPAEPTAPPTPTPAPSGALQTIRYRDLFQEYLGKSQADVQAKLQAAWQQLFYGDDDSQRVYYPVGADMAYIEDIGNQDVRTEGMSYGMMIAVQLDKQSEFKRLWKWARTYMYQSAGPYQGYFAWHCSTDGRQLDANPASDGEEWFVTALFLASSRWGDGQGIYAYHQQAQAILDTMRTKSAEKNGIATDMFDPQAKQVVFVPAGRNATFTDPSYQLPAYYELWAANADQDQQFWKDAAAASRRFFHQAANPQTGLMPDYANFDGTPATTDDHKDFRFDAWRTLSNVAVDYAWFAADPWQAAQSERVLNFLASQGLASYPNQYTLGGQALSADHSTGLVAMAAVAALAASSQVGKPFVQALWDAPIPSGTWRYYDGMLYLLGMLHVSGNFRIR
ncbi:MAG TPA: glycosyl hydrolase family 8 [Anaerolineales bacterium]|nr:glycosyl hydrolase family 8 [Anaerolineales bacterium]